MLHHTTLAYELDGALMARLLNTSPEKLSDKAVRSASKRVAPLCLQPSLQGMGRDGLIRALSRSLGQFLPLTANPTVNFSTVDQCTRVGVGGWGYNIGQGE